MTVWLLDDMGGRIGAINIEGSEIVSTLADGQKVLTFDYPKNAPFAESIKCEYTILTADTRYCIKDTDSATDSRVISVGCKLDLGGLDGHGWATFKTTAKTAAECMATALDGTGWSAVIYGGDSRRRTVKKDSVCSAVDVIERACKVYGLEPEYDTTDRIVRLYAARGRDRGAYICEELGLRRLGVKSSSYDFYTRLIPIGKDGIGINIDGKNYLEDHTYSRKIKTYIWKDERYTHPESLAEDGARKLAELAYPYEVFEIDAERLPGCELGDTVTLISAGERVRGKYRVASITEHPDTPQNDKMELANGKKTFADMQEENDEEVVNEAVGAASDQLAETKASIETTVTESVTATNELLAAALGFYMTDYVTTVNGASVIRRYMHDMPTLGESTLIYTLRDGALLWANGWASGKPQWHRGQVAVGNAILRQIATLKLSAAVIKGGSLANVPISCGTAFAVAADGTVTVKIDGADKNLAGTIGDILTRLAALENK